MKKKKDTEQIPSLSVDTSRQFNAWLMEQNISVLFSTYQSGKLFLIGVKPQGQLSVFERSFARCMGLGGNSDSFFMSTLYQIWRMENMLAPGQNHQGYDRLYVPQVGYTTGDLDVHDIVLDASNRPVFVNTLFSCLASLSETHSFKPLWKPKFISKLAPEDRCHLNGLAADQGQLKYVTAVAQTDIYEGWREYRVDGGIVIDIQSQEIILSGLSMPHSPRIYQDKLWLLNSGTGYLGYVDLKLGKFEPVTFCPGYARGLNFIDHYAVIGLSKIRDNKAFSDLPLDQALKKHKISARCGLQVVDINTGDTVHSLNLEGVITELYDVLLLPGVKRPMALGFKTDEIRRVLSMEIPLQV